MVFDGPREVMRRWWHTADFDFGANTDDIARHHDHGTDRMKKDAALYALQLAMDAAVDTELGLSDYETVQAMAADHVAQFYGDEAVDCALVLPDTDRTTTAFRYHGQEALFEDYVDALPYGSEEVDVVVGVASSGMEPAILAADAFDADLRIVRYSHRRRDDETVIDFAPDYRGERVLLVDDEAYTGTTLTAVEHHVYEHGAEIVYPEPVVDTRDDFLSRIENLFSW